MDEAVKSRGYRHRSGRALCGRLRDLIPRQLFAVAIQAAIGGRIIARETVKALRKDVLAKCYGGDVTRTQAPREGEGRQKASTGSPNAISVVLSTSPF